MTEEHEITITVSEEQMEIARQFEELLGVTPEELVEEAAEGGFERAEEALNTLDVEEL